MAGLFYAAGFQVGGTNTMTATIGGVSVSVDSGYYMPGTLDTNYLATGFTFVGQQYSAFVDQLNAELVSDPTLSVAWNPVTGKYTVAKSGGGTLTITFTGDAGGRLRDALGFLNNKSGSASYTSDFVPNYIVESAIEGRTNVVGPFEAEDIAEMSVSDGGDDFVLTRKTSEQLMTWAQNMEPRTSVYTTASSLIMSWQQFFFHVRGTHPFWCSDSLVGEVDGVFYRLTGKGASYKPMRFQTDDDTFWIVPFDTHYLGPWSP